MHYQYHLPLSPKLLVQQHHQQFNQSPRNFQQPLQQPAQVVDLKQYESKWMAKIKSLEDELQYYKSKAIYIENEYEDLAREAQILKDQIQLLAQNSYPMQFQMNNIDCLKSITIQQESNTNSTALESTKKLDDKEDSYKDQIIELQKMIIKLQSETSYHKIETLKWKNKYIELNKLYNQTIK